MTSPSAVAARSSRLPLSPTHARFCPEKRAFARGTAAFLAAFRPDDQNSGTPAATFRGRTAYGNDRPVPHPGPAREGVGGAERSRGAEGMHPWLPVARQAFRHGNGGDGQV